MKESQKERIYDGVTEKVVKEIMAENFPSLAKDINPQIPGGEWIKKWYKSKDIHGKTHHHQTSKYFLRQKHLESSNRETTPYLQGKTI